MSCLFNSLGRLLNISDTRNEICDFMENNLEQVISGETIRTWLSFESDDANVEKYIAGMRDRCKWGGGIELMIASYIYNTIIIIKQNGKIISTFDCSANETNRYLYLKYTGSHYTPIVIVS